MLKSFTAIHMLEEWKLICKNNKIKILNFGEGDIKLFLYHSAYVKLCWTDSEHYQ